MGVKDLWQLLSPIGRRVSIETLEGKILAIDMSIWITQFIKAMRDDDGKMLKNAHILGTIRRILKLLYHRVRPIFVFDGETPALKRRTIQARRKIHEKHESNRSAAVHKLILAHMKQHIKQQIEQSQNPPEAKSQFATNFVAPGQTSSTQDTANPTKISSDNDAAAEKKNMQTKDMEVDDDEIKWEGGFETMKMKKKHLESESESDEEEPEWFVPDKYEDLNMDVLTSLPAHIRKSIVEDARRKERTKSRSNYIPVADNPLLYSQTQLANFLNTSKLNRRFAAAQKKILGDSDGIRIAADGKKKYMYLSNEINSLKKPNKASSSSSSLNQKVSHTIEKDDMNESGDELTTSDWMIQKEDRPVTSYRTLAKQFEAKSKNKSDSEDDYYDKYDDQWMEELEELEEEENDEENSGGAINLASPQRKFKRLRKGESNFVEQNDLEIVNLLENSSNKGLSTSHSIKVCEPIDLTEETIRKPFVEKSKPLSSFQLIDSPEELVEDKGFYQNLHCDNNDDDNEDFDDVAWESDQSSEKKEVVLAETALDPSTDADRKRKIFEAYLNILSDDDSHHSDDITKQPINATEKAKVIDLSEEKLVTIPKNAEISRVHSSHQHSYPQPTLQQLESQPTKMNSDALNRAVSTAANMADWAGRVVRKVLSEHTKTDIVLPATTSSALVTAEYSTNNELADIEIIPAKSNENHASNSSSVNNLEGVRNKNTSQTVEYLPQYPSMKERRQTSELFEFERNEGNLLSSIPIGDDSEGEATEEVKKRIQQSNRDVERLTEEMKEEVIALIRSFDLPYIISPFEAEAQCAVLQQIGLVDGIITEDSDAFLFGAKEIYKNIFHDNKYVEVYLAEDAKRELGLHREDLIALAYFLGSDYCEGVNGIGIVNAMEIIQAFPMHPMVTIRRYEASQEINSMESSKCILHGLEQFKQWLAGYDVKKEIMLSIEQQFESASKRKKSKQTKRIERKKKGKNSDDVSENSESDDDDSDGSSEDSVRKRKDQGIVHEDFEILAGGRSKEDALQQKDEETVIASKIEDKLSEFDKNHKTGRAKWKVPELFPDNKIAQAYLEPETNRNQAPFKWILPNKEKVRKFCRDILGWTDAMMDSQIDPVLQRYSERSTQSRIDQHFMTYHDDTRFAKIASERLRTTVQQITGKSLVKDMALPKKSRQQSTRKKKSTAAPETTIGTESLATVTENTENSAGKVDTAATKPTTSQSKKE